MRVYELGKELGSGSQAVMAAALKLGIDATAPASGLTEAEVAAIRAALAEDGSPVGDEPEPAVDEGAGPVTGGVRSGYRLVRKGSVTAGRTRVKKGQVVDERVYGGLPLRVRGWFDQV